MYVRWFLGEALASGQRAAMQGVNQMTHFFPLPLVFVNRWHVGRLVFFLGRESDTSSFSSPPASPLSSAGGWSDTLSSSFPSSTAEPSNSSNSSRVYGSQKSFAAGNPIHGDLNFRVKRGVVSCNVAFPVDRKMYLVTHELAGWFLRSRTRGPTCDAWKIRNLVGCAA